MVTSFPSFYTFLPFFSSPFPIPFSRVFLKKPPDCIKLGFSVMGRLREDGGRLREKAEQLSHIQGVIRADTR